MGLAASAGWGLTFWTAGNSIESPTWTWGSNYTLTEISWENPTGVQIVHSRPVGVTSNPLYHPRKALVSGYLNVWAWRVSDPFARHNFICHKRACPPNEDVLSGVCTTAAFRATEDIDRGTAAWIIVLVVLVVLLAIVVLFVLAIRTMNYPLYLKWFVRRRNNVKSPPRLFRTSMVNDDEWAVPPGAATIGSIATSRADPPAATQLEQTGAPKPVELPKLSSRALGDHKMPSRAVFDPFDVTSTFNAEALQSGPSDHPPYPQHTIRPQPPTSLSGIPPPVSPHRESALINGGSRAQMPTATRRRNKIAPAEPQ